MDNVVVDKIESFFANHQESGELVRLPREAPYRLIGAVVPPTMFVYVTKPAVLSEQVISGLPDHVSMIQRYGLPATEDLSWIRHLAGNDPMGFAGDLDPVDLLIFAWLRTQFSDRTIRYLGIDDRLLSELSPAERTRAEISFAPAEVEALPLLEEALPRLAELIGRESHALLLGGRKIELEGVIHGHNWTPERFWQTLLAPMPSQAS